MAKVGEGRIRRRALEQEKAWRPGVHWARCLISPLNRFRLPSSAQRRVCRSRGRGCSRCPHRARLAVITCRLRGRSDRPTKPGGPLRPALGHAVDWTAYVYEQRPQVAGGSCTYAHIINLSCSGGRRDRYVMVPKCLVPRWWCGMRRSSRRSGCCPNHQSNKSAISLQITAETPIPARPRRHVSGLGEFPLAEMAAPASPLSHGDAKERPALPAAHPR